MKKYKIDAINSYASYKQTRESYKKSFVILAITFIILGTALGTGRLEVDKQAFLSANGISLWGLNKQNLQEEVILPQGRICYSLYTTPEEARGIYIPATKADDIDTYIRLAKKTQLNSFVIDVKDDNGYLTFETSNEALKDKGIEQKHPPIQDIDRVIRRMNEAGIYPIARIVAFKDNVYTRYNSDNAVKDLQGDVYVTRAGDKWLDPYNQDNWEYLLAVCEEACDRGFKEIQFDYVRFHESMHTGNIQMEDNQSKKEIIIEFVKYMSEKLHARNIKVSADVFGTVVLSDIDAEIVGQDFTEMSRYLDYISPMIYPSHYAEGTFGIAYPHMDAYHVILNTMKIGVRKMNEKGEKVAEIRPWLQDFTLASKKPYLEYGPKEIKEQIEGAKDAGVRDWLMWNAAGHYTEAGLNAQ